MEIYILRHGEAEQRETGHSDGDRKLTSYGKRDLKAVLKVAHKLGGTADCTVINSTYRTDVGRAAWLNGTLIGTPQSDSPSNAHAAANVVPAIMAIAERDRLDGKAFLAALILGGEVGGRIEAASLDVETKRGFHNPAVQGPFSAAAAVGKLLGFDEDTMVHALGIAGSSSAGLQEFAFEGADMKATHEGRASQLGLESALLAQSLSLVNVLVAAVVACAGVALGVLVLHDAA